MTKVPASHLFNLTNVINLFLIKIKIKKIFELLSKQNLKIAYSVFCLNRERKNININIEVFLENFYIVDKQ